MSADAEVYAVPLADGEKVADDGAHRIVVSFVDDHTIEGAKIEIADVTPEQIMLAVFYLTRTANQIADARMMRAAKERGEVSAVAAALRSGNGIHLPGRKRGN